MAGQGKQSGWWIVASVIAVMACENAISPQPEPPGRGILSIDASGIQSWIEPDSKGFVGLRGAPGCAKPAGATVRATPLYTPQDPNQSVIHADGSFEIPLAMELGDEVRLQIHTDFLRSEPLDLQVAGHGVTMNPVSHPLACLTLVPSSELDLTSGSETVLAINGCSTPVVLETPTFRRSTQSIRITGTSWPVTLQPEKTWEISFESDESPSGFEEIVFLPIASPQRDRRAITLFASPK